MTSDSTAFERNLHELGPNGFADWLIASFCSQTPGPKLGRFHSDEDRPFHEVFAASTLAFANESKWIASEGISIALKAFDRRDCSYFGLLEVFGAAEFLDVPKKNDELARILSNWLPPSKQNDARIANRNAILDLRDILEVVFRDMAFALSEWERRAPDFQQISLWCAMILSASRPSRQLLPAMAPIYAISLVIAAQGSADKLESNWGVLAAGFLTQQDKHSELFFHRFGTPIKSYPYDLQGLYRVSEDLKRHLSGGRVMPRLVMKDDPFDQPRPSATLGIRYFVAKDSGGTASQEHLEELAYG